MSSLILTQLRMEDSAEGGLTQFWEFFTMIPCGLRDFRRKLLGYLGLKLDMRAL